jgi:uncharacterized protein (DUF1330 family)
MQEAYLIGTITVKNKEKWYEYRSKVTNTLLPWGGKLVFRGKKAVALAGNTKHNFSVIISFPNIDSLKGWFSSIEYQSIIPLREEAADMDLVCYQLDN